MTYVFNPYSSLSEKAFPFSISTRYIGEAKVATGYRPHDAVPSKENGHGIVNSQFFSAIRLQDSMNVIGFGITMRCWQNYMLQYSYSP